MFTKNCPRCGIEMTYKRNRDLTYSLRNNSHCLACRSVVHPSTRSVVTEEREALILRLHSEGLSQKAIAARAGVSSSVIWRYLRQNGIEPNHRRPQKVRRTDGGKKAICSRCDEEKDISKFKTGSGGYTYSYCIDCFNQNEIVRRTKTLLSMMKARVRSVSTRCRKNGLSLNIDAEYLVDMFERQGGKCYYTDVPMVTGAVNKNHPFGVSIDRVDVTRGYERGNIVLCAYRVNTVKNDLKIDECMDWLPKIAQRVSDFGRMNYE